MLTLSRSRPKSLHCNCGRGAENVQKTPHKVRNSRGGLRALATELQSIQQYLPNSMRGSNSRNATSTCDAECNSGAEAVKQTLWLCQLLGGFGGDE